MPTQPLIGQNIDGRLKVENPTPNPSDEIMVGILESNVGDYVASLMGTPPPQGAHPEQLLTQQIPIDWAHVQRTYAKDRTAQQTYNYSISYDAEDVTVPIFTRDYIVRRYGYTPLSKGTPLLGFMSATVLSGGTGYTQETVDDITSNGATIRPVISNGAVVHLAIIAEGTATANLVNFSITGGLGAGGAGTAFVQPQTAVLSKEDLIRTQDSPLDGLWVLVRRTYTTLPGAILTEYEADEETQVVIKTTYQIVTAPTVAPTQANGLLISYRKIDSVRSLKITRDFRAFLSFSYDEQKFAADQFPSLFDFSTYLYIDGCGAFSQLRAALSAKTQIRTHVTYTTSKQTIAGLVLLPKSLMLGRGVQINTNVIVDDYDFTFTGACTYEVTGTGSTPSYSTYVGTIQGTEQLVAGESVLWKAGIYKNTYVYEIMI